MLRATRHETQCTNLYLCIQHVNINALVKSNKTKAIVFFHYWHYLYQRKKKICTRHTQNKEKKQKRNKYKQNFIFKKGKGIGFLLVSFAFCLSANLYSSITPAQNSDLLPDKTPRKSVHCSALFSTPSTSQ